MSTSITPVVTTGTTVSRTRVFNTGASPTTRSSTLNTLSTFTTLASATRFAIKHPRLTLGIMAISTVATVGCVAYGAYQEIRHRVV